MKKQQHRIIGPQFLAPNQLGSPFIGSKLCCKPQKSSLWVVCVHQAFFFVQQVYTIFCVWSSYGYGVVHISRSKCDLYKGHIGFVMYVCITSIYIICKKLIYPIPSQTELFLLPHTKLNIFERDERARGIISYGPFKMRILAALSTRGASRRVARDGTPVT